MTKTAQYAGVMELVDVVDSKSAAIKACRFKSGHQHHTIQNLWPSQRWFQNRIIVRIEWARTESSPGNVRCLIISFIFSPLLNLLTFPYSIGYGNHSQLPGSFKGLPGILRGYGGIGRHAGFRFQWATVQVQVLLPAPNIVCLLLSEWCVATSFYQSLQTMSLFLSIF